jgi:cold shock CspA family protein
METNFYKGRLKRWNDDKGFGFIEAENGKKDIFIHISALKRMSRRPVVGDIINYQIHIGNDGKNRAVNAKIEGVTEIQPQMRGKNISTHDNGKWVYVFFTMTLLILAVFAFYYKVIDTLPAPATYVPPEQNEQSADPEQTTYRCEGKVYCSEMSSCEEAMFYLEHCPGTKLDGDGDGIPCEKQWCR